MVNLALNWPKTWLTKSLVHEIQIDAVLQNKLLEQWRDTLVFKALTLEIYFLK